MPTYSTNDEDWNRWFAVRDPYPISGIDGCLHDSDSSCQAAPDSVRVRDPVAHPISYKAHDRYEEDGYNFQPANGVFQPGVVADDDFSKLEAAQYDDQFSNYNFNGSQPTGSKSNSYQSNSYQSKHVDPTTVSAPRAAAPVATATASQSNNAPVRYSARENRIFDQMHHNGDSNEAIAVALNRSENAISIRRGRIYGTYSDAHASDAARAQNGTVRAPRVRRQPKRNSNQ